RADLPRGGDVPVRHPRDDGRGTRRARRVPRALTGRPGRGAGRGARVGTTDPAARPPPEAVSAPYPAPVSVCAGLCRAVRGLSGASTARQRPPARKGEGP